MESHTESNPPLFQSSLATAVSEKYDNTYIEAGELIPRLDLQTLNSDVDPLSTICKTWGLFHLYNHEIPSNLLAAIVEQARAIFSLPFETKQKILVSPLSYFWGTPALTPSGVALERSQDVNWVEGINIPCSHLAQLNPSHLLLYPIRILLQEYETHLVRIATTIFEAMQKAIRSDYRGYLSEATGILRLHRYPKCEGDKWGIDEHTDSSVLTILNQDHVGGLEVYREGRWISVPPIRGSLVVNLGDMAQAISDDKFVSAKHRVRVSRYSDRLSIGYFVFPPHDYVIKSSVYKPFTYGDFQLQVQRDIKNSGAKIGLDRFRL